MPKQETWYVYLLLCADDTLYCGITNDAKRRVKMHNDGKASRYTRARLPVKLLYKTKIPGKSNALKLEHFIKALPRKQKWQIIENKGYLKTIYDLPKR